MKSILIERVNNGWIVRPFSPCQNWTKADCVDMWVFSTMGELAAKLPELLMESETTTVEITSKKYPLAT